MDVSCNHTITSESRKKSKIINIGNIGYNLTKEQTDIICSEFENVIINGVPGSAKTTTLILRLERKLRQTETIYNIILLTKVSNVTEVLVNRLVGRIPEIKLEYTTTSRVAAEYNGHCIEFSNDSAFVDCQLRHYQNKGNTLEYKENNKIKKINKKIYQIGKDFRLKKKIYNHLILEDKLDIVLKNGKKVNKIILDELQDFTQAEAITFLSIIKNNSNISFEGYGDILQSIFYKLEINETTKKYSNLPIHIFEKIDDIRRYSLSKCFRCPKSHCMFLKNLNKEANKKYNRKSIESNSKENDLFKPMYFQHNLISNNATSQDVANNIFSIISIFIEEEKLSPGKITVIVTSINKNIVCEKLEVCLKNKNLQTVLFKTKSNDTTQTIDMNKLKEERCSNCKKKFNKKSNKCKNCKQIRKRDKIAIISGHGFKGGESECVIAFGLSEYSLPKKNHPGTPNELADLSLINVMLSRSYKYLIMGSNFNPSRYLTNNIHGLSEHLYLVQDFSSYLNKEINNELNISKYGLDYINKLKKLKEYYEDNNIEKIKKTKMRKKKQTNQYKNNIKRLETIKNFLINDLTKPKIYDLISKKLQSNSPCCNNPLKDLFIKNNKQLNTPDKNKLTVTDITENYDEYIGMDELLQECYTCETDIFGEKNNIEYKNITSLLGHLPNIIISINNKDLFYENLKKIISDDGSVLYVDETKYNGIFNILKDICSYKNFLVGFTSIDIDLLSYVDTLPKNDLECLNKFTNDYSRRLNCGKILLPNYFKGIFNNMDLDTNKKIWNVCLLWDFIYCRKYVEQSYMVNGDVEYFSGSLQTAIKNIYSNCEFFENLQLEIPCNPKCHIERSEKILEKELLFDKNKDEKIFREGFPCTVEGRIDGYINNNLFEFKMSLSDTCKKEWIIQILLYSYLGIKKYEKDEDFKDDDAYEIVHFRDAFLYNFITGKKTSIVIDLKKLKINMGKIFELILSYYNFTPKLKNNFIKKIK